MKKLSIYGLFALAMLFAVNANAQGGVTQPVLIQTLPDGTSQADPNSATPAELPGTTIDFPELTFNFGSVTEGDIVNHKFVFKNTGANPAKIENVKPSCGCTTPDWTKDEVPSGGEGFIEMSFNSSGKQGMQNKSLTVTYNGIENKFIALSFSGEVKPKVVEAPAPGN